MSQVFEIQIFNRYSKKKELEKVYGHKAVEFAYQSTFGKLIGGLISSKITSKAYGHCQDSKSSAQKVPRFIQNFDIKIEDYQKGSFKQNEIEHSYKSFNEFFIRKFKNGKRDFIQEPGVLAACAEARYFGHEKMTDDLSVPVKGAFLKPSDLLGSSKWAEAFKGGPLVIARLCPVDYHRYHYPDDGKTIDHYTVSGDLHSVNPIALKYRPDIFIKNERRVAILETENFGRLAYIEVGATCVGKIVQTFDEGHNYKRGDEKGYFLFGGSTVIICGEPGRWKPCPDIIANTDQGLETFIRLGDRLGVIP